jgi:hypothetical protein
MTVATTMKAKNIESSSSISNTYCPTRRKNATAPIAVNAPKSPNVIVDAIPIVISRYENMTIIKLVVVKAANGFILDSGKKTISQSGIIKNKETIFAPKSPLTAPREVLR